MNYEINLKTLQLANDLLGELSNEIVFVGGITTFLYVDVDIADDIRPTRDVDFVIDTTKKNEYDQFQDKLRKKGFTHDISEGAPICRFKYGEDLNLKLLTEEVSLIHG